jgi:hypothetical protein
MRCLLTPTKILLLTGAILTLKIITDGDHSLSSNLGFLSCVRSVCGLCAACAVVCGRVRCCAVVCGFYLAITKNLERRATTSVELANDVGAPC